MSAINKLTPAAARLALATLAAQPGDTLDTVVARAGIHAYATVARARECLRVHGFIATDLSGQEYIVLSAEK